MARITTSIGLCPVCSETVPRAIHAGSQREVFRCREHGRLEYGPSLVPLDALRAIEPAPQQWSAVLTQL